MKYKINRCILFTFLVFMLCQLGQAEPMTIHYDNKIEWYTLDPITLYVNGEVLETQVMPPIQLENYVLVPAREVFTYLGAQIEWRPEEKSVYVYDETNLIILNINNKEAWVNETIKLMDMPAKLINDKVMIPLRFISEALGFKVEWFGDERNVFINSVSIEPPNNEVPPTNGEESNTEVSRPEDGDYNEEVNIPVELTENIHIDTLNNTLILDEILIDQIKINDLYTERKIVIDLQGDFSSLFNEGIWTNSLGLITGIEVSHTEGTKISITTSTICTPVTYMENNSVYIRCAKPREVFDKIIVLDPGHGGEKPGTCYEDIQEKDMTLTYGKALFDLLEQDESIKVYMTRQEDVHIDLMDRVYISNEIEPDLFISIHINSVENIPAAKGVETWYTSSNLDQRNKLFAEIVQRGLVNTFGMNNRGVKPNEFVVIKYTDAPAILIESGFLTNSEDRALMLSDTYAQQYATSIYMSLYEYFRILFQ